MSKTAVNQYMNVCANCAYWDGPRNMDGFFGRMEVECSANTTGKCTNRNGFYNCNMIWQATCANFEKQPIVKR